MKVITIILIFTNTLVYGQSYRYKDSVKPSNNPLLALEGACILGRWDSMLPPKIMFRAQNPSAVPLYIIDEVPQSKASLERISPADIESISILKDTDAKAIYGIKGANGVVLITTKKKHTVWKHWLWPSSKIVVNKSMTGHQYRQQRRAK